MNEKSVSDDQIIIDQTQCWVETVIVGNNFCPFAKRELERGSIRYHVKHNIDLESALQAVIDECVHLDDNESTETTLLIFAEDFKDFDNYLELVELGENLIADQGYEGIYQFASFHPDYCFAGAEHNDAANYTNRSPFPMLHLIREASVEQVLKHYPEPEKIPEHNIERARELGLEEMKRQLDLCRKTDN